MADLERLRAGGWTGVVLTEQLDAYPTMLVHDERRLLHWLARDVWEGWGAIVDAGCFLGGSTASFASGLRARATPAQGGPRPPVWSYDRFEAEPYMVEERHLERWPQIRVGDSFQPAFEDLLGDLVTETRVCAGDITAQPWDGGPIEILFLDVLKSSAINDAVLMQFLPALVPGRSVLIQQDYVHGMLPWIHITMELLGDAVERVADISGSRVYAVTGALSAERLAEVLPLGERVSPEHQREAMAQALADAWGDTRGMVLLAYANLLRAQGELARAGALLEHVEAHYADAHAVAFDAEKTREVLERCGWAPALA
ncbi:MAG: hypothetical protein ACTHOE_10635 [Conexibacter sp.]